MECMACYYEFEDLSAQVCPRCGMQVYALQGNMEGVAQMLKEKADGHRRVLLSQYDLGFIAYYWKDEDGKLALKEKLRHSLCSADQAEAETNAVWYPKKFGRITDPTMEVQLSIRKKNAEEKLIPVKIDVPQETQLQRIGVRLNSDLSLTVLVGNESTCKESEKVFFME